MRPGQLPFDPRLIHLGLTVDGEYYELEFTFFHTQDVVAQFVKPEYLAGLELDIGHVPAFSMPTLFGFVYQGRPSIWAFERMKKELVSLVRAPQ